MTDKEKAEEYVKTNHSHIMSGTMKSIYKKIYLDGLAEGRKEEHDKWCSNPFWVMQLERENAEVKTKIENLKKTYRKQRNKRIDELQKKNAELKADKEYLDKVNNEQTEVILKLNAQIEKMKCCGNCKHCFSKNDEDNVITCAYDDEFAYLSLRKCEKWECVK